MTTKPKVQRSTGILNKMRDKMALIMIILIVAFLGTIVFDWGMNYLGMQGENYVFGKVNGVEINAQEFSAEVQKRIENQKIQSKKSDLDDQSVQQIKDQVWSEFVNRILLDQECKKLGISVSDDEVLNWVYDSPETLPDAIKKYFSDSTGAFRSDVYEQALNDKRPEIKEFWVAVEQYLRETLIQSKLYAVFAGSAIVSEGEVLQKYRDDNIKANLEYVLFDLAQITDTSFNNVTDAELKDYYEKNKDDYKQEEAVKFKYVIFSDAATLEDTNSVIKDLELLVSDLKSATVEDSSLIVLLNETSANPYNDAFQKPNALGKNTINFLFGSQKDSVSGVIADNDGYHLIKLLDSKDGEDTYVNAEHILVNFGNDTAAAKKKAEDIYKKIKSGDKFTDLAIQYSEDPSAKQNNGDLGWFTKGSMVKEFEEACFKASIGDVVGPVKTQFGFHIIKIKGKSKKEFKFADIKKTVVASMTTKGIVKDKAQDFYNNVEKGEVFDSLAKKLNLQVSLTPEVSEGGFLPGAGQNKSILKFGFENKVNSVNKPAKVQGGFGIYQIVQKIPAGYKNFDSIKTAMIKPKVVNEKKFQYLLTTSNDAKNKISNNNLNSLSSFYPQIKVETADSVTVSKSIPSAGQDFALMNAIFELKTGDVSGPIKGQKGYYIVRVISMTTFDQNDYNSKAADLRKQLLSSKQQSMYQEFMTNLQNKADILDNRDLL